MLRAFLVALACAALSACWTSERQFFDSGDWAPLDLAGTYSVETAGESGQSVALISSLPDGRIAIDPASVEGDQEKTVLGPVAIPGGSGRFFLADDRSTLEEAHLYWLVQVGPGGGLAFYSPDCSGTPWTEGIVVEEEAKGGASCLFADKDALLRAALEAERFLARPHIVKVAPFRALSPMAEEVVEETADEPTS